MELKLWLTFLMVCGIPDVESTSNQWKIDVPSQITALQGSCVVIPCTYSYPKTRQMINNWLAFWKRGKTIVATNLPKFKHKPEFKRRTRILGSVQHGNCTMQMISVRTTDVGPFYLHIQIPRYKRFTFSKNTVTIDVKQTPEPPTMSVSGLDKVTASCTVSHSCPSFPPQFVWSHSGIKTKTSKPVNKWLWTTTSTITFHRSPDVFNQTLSCTVKFRGKKTAENSVILFE